jgi:hypothetical protein
MLAPLKLAAGQAWAAWRRYPALRRSLAAAPPGAPILVTGMYRTGTTWVGAMLAPAGLWALHEPFNPNQGLWDEELAYARADRPHTGIDALVGALVRGRHRSVLRLPTAGRWFTPLRLLPHEPRRILVKDPSAALLAEYLVRRHGVRALVVLRHPAAVTASFLRLGWPTHRLVARLLEDQPLLEDWLGPHARMMEAATGRADARSGAVLYAAVATALLGFERRNPGTISRLAFEDLCADPIARFRALFAELGLPYDARVADEHARLTSGAGRAERPHGVVRESVAVAGKWRSELPAAERDAVRAVWEAFDLPLYRSSADWEAGEPRPGDERSR